ncbi:MAG: hypothetical protein FJ222_02100 [Lentisphaerae bacterium]|nr:hypothetical protein [Lentisphaerota bacterium]
MQPNPTILHLANVLMIAEADGVLTEPEAFALREIMHRIGADADDLAKARDWMAHHSPYHLQEVQNSADAMKMIEDMVLMSLADGQVSRDESQPLEAFLSGLGFVQADMDMIVQRVRSRLRAIPATPHPSMPIRRDAVAEVPAQAARHVTPPPVFARISPPALQSPSTHQRPIAHPTPAHRHATPAPVLVAEPPPHTAPPVSAIPPPVVPKETPLERCQRHRASAPQGVCYCFGAPEGPLNPWGCRLMRMAWTSDADWLRLGRFRDSDTFVLDHEAISARLSERLTSVAGCPFLLTGFAQQALNALPSQATTMGRWRHHLVSQTAPSATAVTVRSYSHGCAREVAAWADGLAPTDDRDARQMIRRAARLTGVAVDLTLLNHTKEADHA